MRILNVRLARVIWLVDFRDLNPYGLDLFRSIAALRDRYEFKSFPTAVGQGNESDQKEIVFANGSFAVGDQQHAVMKATMFSDGLVVDTALSTDFSEAFMSDALTFLSTDFGLTYSPEMIHKRIYVSELIVRPEKNLDGVLGRLSPIGKMINSATNMTFAPSGFALSVDPGSGPQPVSFKFERESGKPFDQNRFYSSAPLRTGEHEDVLRKLESIL
jgi:hypothetical protein